MTVVAVEKKAASRFTKKGKILEDTHEIAMEAIRPWPSPSRDLTLLGIMYAELIILHLAHTFQGSLINDYAEHVLNQV